MSRSRASASAAGSPAVLAQAVATRQVIGEGDDPDLVNDLD